MSNIVEMEIFSKPKEFYHQDFGKTHVAPTFAKEGLPKEIVIGLSNIPDDTDMINLRLHLNGHEGNTKKYQEFCHKHHINPNSNEAACKYLAYIEGTPLAWVHIPEDKFDFYYRKVLDIANKNEWILVDTYEYLNTNQNNEIIHSSIGRSTSK